MEDYLHYRNLRSTERLSQKPDDLDHHYQNRRGISGSEEEIVKNIFGIFEIYLFLSV
jgi:hypothetical protein